MVTRRRPVTESATSKRREACGLPDERSPAGRAYGRSKIRRAPGLLGPAALVRGMRQVGAAHRGNPRAGRRVLHTEPGIARRGSDDDAGVLVEQPVGDDLGGVFLAAVAVR